MKEVRLLFVLCIGLFLMTSCDDDDETTPEEENIFGLVMNDINDGENTEYWNTRSTFVQSLTQKSGVLNDNGFQAFFATDPTYSSPTDIVNITVGLTEYDSENALKETATSLATDASFINYASTFNSLSTIALKPLDGEGFNPSSLILSDSTVIEFAIRKAKNADSFGSLRDAFFGLLPSFSGFQFDREFAVYDIAQDGSLSRREDFQAVMIVWDGPTNFFSAAGQLFPLPEFGNFSNSLETEFYFVTNPRN